MTSFLPNTSSVFGKLRLNVYVDASSESIIQWASRRQTSMAASAPEAEVTAMAEGFATAIFLFDSLKEIQVTVRTRTAAQKLAFLRELIYQDPQIQPICIPADQVFIRTCTSEGSGLSESQTCSHPSGEYK